MADKKQKAKQPASKKTATAGDLLQAVIDAKQEFDDAVSALGTPKQQQTILALLGIDGPPRATGTAKPKVRNRKPRQTEKELDDIRKAVLAAVPAGKANAKGRAGIEDEMKTKDNIAPQLTELVNSKMIKRSGKARGTVYYK